MTPKHTPSPLSKCCKAPLTTTTADEGTSFWICSSCQKPSDPVDTPSPELDELLAAYRDSIIETLRQVLVDGDYTGKPELPSGQTLRRAIEAWGKRQSEDVARAKDNAYWERNQLVMYLSKLYPSHLAVHPDTDHTWDDEWRIIICVHTPQGQACWHIHNSDAKYFTHLKQEPNDWDGHTTEEKYLRLATLQSEMEKTG